MSWGGGGGGLFTETRTRLIDEPSSVFFTTLVEVLKIFFNTPPPPQTHTPHTPFFFRIFPVTNVSHCHCLGQALINFISWELKRYVEHYYERDVDMPDIRRVSKK